MIFLIYNGLVVCLVNVIYCVRIDWDVEFGLSDLKVNICWDIRIFLYYSKIVCFIIIKILVIVEICLNDIKMWLDLMINVNI